ncbi:HlyD family type I secretion periplasmic adaptor subunit [uncultured Phenylobacterium sp.]|uniref:HlyD family type I secretion periplasmic adaptor subunit n=1 Tax=uncultured Phenylobacterium sp. TaxID=349273 RepID=UPI0025FB9661|nr:HlyD family type I secretion periplasmic adaptor subunit [uncultured Phenylobacterium sp.]
MKFKFGNLTNVLPFRPSETPDTEAPKLAGDYKRVARVGLLIIVATFGVLGLWAAVSPLDSAVIAPGVVSVETNRKTVQHLEGGIVRRVLVREGDEVKAGQVLFELDALQARATFEMTRNQLVTFFAQSARLVAERDRQATIAWPAELTANAGDPLVTRAMADEQQQFLERRATLQGQTDLLNARISQFRSEIDGINRQQQAMEEQIAYLGDEIDGLRQIYEKGLVPRPRLLALERERSGLRGSIGRAIADRTKAEKGINEASLQIRQIRQQFNEEVSRSLAEVQPKVADLRERYSVASDAVTRVQVRAPVTGSAQNLRIFTDGAVIAPGAPLVDIVPRDETLVINAQVSTTDVDNIRPGMKAEIRFPSFHARNIPVIEGTIHTISGDRLVNEANDQPYFLAIVQVDPVKLPAEIRSRLNAGLPAEVIITTGQRSTLQYLWSPLSNALRKTMREE